MQELKCPECGKVYHQNFVLCMKCGTRLKAYTAPPAQQRVIPSEPHVQSVPPQAQPVPSPQKQAPVSRVAVNQSAATGNSTGTSAATPAVPPVTGISGARGSFTFNGDIITLGRSRSSQIFIDNNAIGRYHALFEKVNGEWFITDKESKNFTYINGQKIGANTRYRLTKGMKVKFANEEYTVV